MQQVLGQSHAGFCSATPCIFTAISHRRQLHAVEFSLTLASSLPYLSMPLDLVQGIDDALAELVDWRTRKLRVVNRDDSPSEREAWLWSGLPTKPVDQICRLLLSPVFYALCERVYELVIYCWKDHSTGSLIVAGIVLLSLVRYAEPLIPFRNIRITAWRVLPALIFMLFLIRFQYKIQVSVFNSHLVLLDAFSTPFIGHLLNHTTDREQIHYFFYGIIISYHLT
jgi:hypothetical protein